MLCILLFPPLFLILHGVRKEITRNYLSGCSLQLAYDTKISHATGVNTLEPSVSIGFMVVAATKAGLASTETLHLERTRR